MIITNLIFNNFGIYAGYNIFEFKSSKKVVLIGGMNGRGKTTFLEGVLLALYGANSFAYIESKYTSYGQYLKAHVNTLDKTLDTYIELEFKLENEERYVIRRSWSGISERPREKIQVKKDGKKNDFLTNNWSMFIESILPSALAGFFFFDGEKIAELAVENTNTQMKESIKMLLGISIIDRLNNDISKIVSKVKKNSREQNDIKELELLKEIKNKAYNELSILDKQILEVTEEFEETKKKLEKTEHDYISNGGNIVEQHKELFLERNRMAADIENIEESLISIAADKLPLILVKDLISNIQTQALKEHETKFMGYTLEKINRMYDSYINKFNQSNKDIKEFISYIKNEAKQESIEIIFDISEQTLFQINSLLNNSLIQIRDSMVNKVQKCNQYKDKIEEIDNYLNVDTDEKLLAKIYKNIKILEKRIIELEVIIEKYNKERTVLNGNLIRATSEYNKFVEKMLCDLENSDDDKRIMKYSHYAVQILSEYKLRLQHKKIGILSDTITKCYKMLSNKKNFINRIEVDANTLDFVYLNLDNKVVPKESLSAGEKQLMVISLLWSLAICSNKKLPVIIDTPLSRMDSIHRISLIKTYFPNASDQTIILSTDSEIDNKYYNIMKETVGDEFTLIYDEARKCSKIEKGYFIGEKNDN